MKEEKKIANVNDRIVHRDLVDMGIVFLEIEQEQAFLERVNEEFAYLVGLEAMSQISRGHAENRYVDWSKVECLLDNNRDKCDSIRKTVRSQILQSLKERRRQFLTGEVPGSRQT